MPFGQRWLARREYAEPQAVQQFRAGAEKVLRMPSTPGRWCMPAPPGHTAPLPPRLSEPGSSGGRCRWTKAPPDTGGSLRRAAPQRQRGFTRPRHAPAMPTILFSGMSHVDVFQVVYLCPAHEHLSIILFPFPLAFFFFFLTDEFHVLCFSINILVYFPNGHQQNAICTLEHRKSIL